MQKPFVVGLTGVIGSGKSTVAEVLRQRGALIIDADVLAREVVAPGSSGLAEIVEHFGPDYLHRDGTLNRSMLGELIFRDAEQRKALESILHPKIRDLFVQQLRGVTAEAPMVVYVVPLLFESINQYPEIDAVVVVSASAAQCLERIVARDGCSREIAEKKLASQIPIDVKRKQADFIIENDGVREATERASHILFDSLLTLARSRPNR